MLHRHLLAELPMRSGGVQAPEIGATHQVMCVRMCTNVVCPVLLRPWRACANEHTNPRHSLKPLWALLVLNVAPSRYNAYKILVKNSRTTETQTQTA
jgi:hypothetical protein